MMYISISGSTILSATHRLKELFTPYNDGIEIGFLENENAWRIIVDLVHRHKMKTWGVHFPRLRAERAIANHLTAVTSDHREYIARTLLTDARITADHGGHYILVHFPFFSSSSLPLRVVRARIEHGIQLLRYVAEQSPIPIVIECKLGLRRDPGGIAYVVEWGQAFFQQLTGVRLCLDVGDWCIAAMRMPKVQQAFKILLSQATHLHLHGVALKEKEKYYWTPVEEKASLPGVEGGLTDIIAQFAAGNGQWIVCEHTPHAVEGAEQVIKGYKWLRETVHNIT